MLQESFVWSCGSSSCELVVIVVGPFVVGERVLDVGVGVTVTVGV